MATYLESVEVLRHNVRPHQTIVDLVSTLLVVITHSTCSSTLVEPLVDVFSGDPQLAEALAERLSRFEHRDDRRLPRRAWLGSGSVPGIATLQKSQWSVCKSSEFVKGQVPWPGVVYGASVYLDVRSGEVDAAQASNYFWRAAGRDFSPFIDKDPCKRIDCSS